MVQHWSALNFNFDSIFRSHVSNSEIVPLERLNILYSLGFTGSGQVIEDLVSAMQHCIYLGLFYSLIAMSVVWLDFFPRFILYIFFLNFAHLWWFGGWGLILGFWGWGFQLMLFGACGVGLSVFFLGWGNLSVNIKK